MKIAAAMTIFLWGSLFNETSLATEPTESEVTVPCYKASARVCEIEYWIFKYSNDARARAGVRRAIYSRKLAFAGREWAKRRDRRRTGHIGFPGQRRRSIVNEFGSVGMTIIAENVWWGGYYRSANSKTPKQIGYRIYKSWMDSRGHRQSLLKRNRKYMGIGVAYRGGYYYATQLFAR